MGDEGSFKASANIWLLKERGLKEERNNLRDRVLNVQKLGSRQKLQLKEERKGNGVQRQQTQDFQYT